MKITLLLILFTTNLFCTAQSNNNKNMNTDKVKIEIWSDVVCPFCYVGKRKLEQALVNLNAQDKVEIIWHSFQLDPDFPLNTFLPSSQYLIERKGYPANQVTQICAQLTEQGKDYNIHFQFDKALTFNTFNIHRLLQWSKTFGKSNELKEAFLVAYFSDGINLSNQENILEVVKKVGLDSEKALEILNSEQFTTELNSDLYQARQLGIRGVPYFLINEKEIISGAQNDNVFENVISAALKNIKPTDISTKEGICIPNDVCK